MAKSVTVYSTTHCGACAQLKKWMDEKQINYDAVNIEENPDRMSEMIEKAGTMQVPVTFIRDEGDDSDDSLQVVAGANYAEVSKVLGLA